MPKCSEFVVYCSHVTKYFNVLLSHSSACKSQGSSSGNDSKEGIRAGKKFLMESVL